MIVRLYILARRDRPGEFGYFGSTQSHCRNNCILLWFAPALIFECMQLFKFQLGQRVAGLRSTHEYCEGNFRNVKGLQTLHVANCTQWLKSARVQLRHSEDSIVIVPQQDCKRADRLRCAYPIPPHLRRLIPSEHIFIHWCGTDTWTLRPE